MAVIAQAVLDLRQTGEVSMQSAADAARFLMDRLWQNDTPWSTLALENNEWLTVQKVDRLVAQKIAPNVVPMLPVDLRRRLQANGTVDE